MSINTWREDAKSKSSFWWCLARGSGQKLEHRRVPLITRQQIFTEGDPVLAQFAQGGCGASILGLILRLVSHGPGQLGLGDLASAGVWNGGSSPSQPFCCSVIQELSWFPHRKTLVCNMALLVLTIFFWATLSFAGYMTKHIPAQSVLFILMCRWHFTQALLALFNYSNPILEDVQQCYLSLSKFGCLFISLAALQQ